MNKREFIKQSALLATSVTILPNFTLTGQNSINKKLRTAHIGVGNMGAADLKDISSHPLVEIVALCDVDSNNLAKALALHPKAKTYKDYRVMFQEIADDIDAVVVSTPDHTHAPASMLAMNLNKPVYCQKPLTHHVSEARAMSKLAAEKNLVTQMGIQVHSFYDYKLATYLIQSGIIGKVKRVHAWSPKTWGYDGIIPTGKDAVPETLDWNLWLGTAAERDYQNGVYHPGQWRKLTDFGCGTLGDMGVHIFDTPYNALALGVPKTITNNCQRPNGFSFPVNNVVTYEFPGTEFTTDEFEWIWYDGPGAPAAHEDLAIPMSEKSVATVAETSKKTTETGIHESLNDVTPDDENSLPEQGAMFIGEKGRLLLPHFMQLPRKIVDGKFVDISKEIEAVEKANNIGKPIRNYNSEGPKHYHQFVDACLGKDECSAPFSYAANLTETILLGVIAGRFPNMTLHWDSVKAKFEEEEANMFLEGDYREF